MDFKERAKAAHERKEKLNSFGPHAFGLLVDTHNGFFVVDVEDTSVSGSLLKHGTYADNEFNLFQSFISEKSEVLVVGAHIGSHVVRLAKKCKNVVAIEANPNTFKYLKANLALNACKTCTII